MKTGVKKGSIGVTLIAAIVYTAVSLIGQRETTNNSGFADKSFQREMEQVGWHKYDSWCVYFCKLVWHRAIDDSAVNITAMKLITGNSQSTLANFTRDRSGYFYLSDTAAPGSIVIWQQYQNGKGLWRGHAGIVIEHYPAYFVTVEGNTNSSGGREGYMVARKTRKYSRDVNNGLRLRKFIAIKKTV